MAAWDEAGEARQLLKAAARDCRALTGMGNATIFADEVFGFHAQQAAEKALKAWLALLGVEYPKTHDLSFLLNMLQNHGQVVENWNFLIGLNPYAVQYRYEAFDEMGFPLDRDTVGRLVEELLRKIEALVEQA